MPFYFCLIKLNLALILLNGILLQPFQITLEEQSKMSESPIPRWLSVLSEEDFHFIKRFILASGSLKELAKQYQVSYPTLRIRLNRLIEKISVADDPDLENPFLLEIRLMVADGTLTQAAARTLIRAYEKGK